MGDKKKLLLTGASRGIGHATVKHFNAAGWEVFTASRQNWVAECPWAEGLLNHIHLDLEDIDSVSDSMAAIKDKLGGRLDALVNNAGISPKGADGSRMGRAGKRLRHLDQGVQRQSVLHRTVGPRPVRRAESRQGQHHQCHLHCRVPRCILSPGSPTPPPRPPSPP